MARATDGLSSIAEAMFPRNDVGAPDFVETDVVERTLTYLQELPPKQAKLILLLFIFVELAAPILCLSFRRFSRMDVEKRTESIRSWRTSKVLLLRLLGDAVKAQMTMMYMSHPKVTAYIGEKRP
jgi:hypothetical protein